MNLTKGTIIHFLNSDRKETIVKGSRDPINGMIKTDLQEYSCHFILSWLEFGFLELIKKQ